MMETLKEYEWILSKVIDIYGAKILSPMYDGDVHKIIMPIKQLNEFVMEIGGGIVDKAYVAKHIMQMLSDNMYIDIEKYEEISKRIQRIL